LGVYLLITACTGSRAGKGVKGLADTTIHAARGATSWTVAKLRQGIGSAAKRSLARPTFTLAMEPNAAQGKWARAGRILIEAASGAAVAVLLVGILFTHTGRAADELVGTLVVSALAGGAIGFLLGVSRHQYKSMNFPEKI
jgi:hypothetical protein